MSIRNKSFEHTKLINQKSENTPAVGARCLMKSRKIPVALRFDGELLALIDAMATRRGMSRNAIISYWCSKGVESE